MDHKSINSATVNSGCISPFNLKLHIDSSQNEEDNIANHPDDLDDKDSKSSNKLKKLLDVLSTNMDKNSVTSVTSKSHSPFCKTYESKN